MWIFVIVFLVQLQERIVDANSVLNFEILPEESLKLGGKIKRICSATDAENIKGEISWNSDGLHLPKFMFTVASNYFEYTDLTPYLTGVYTCHATLKSMEVIQNSFYLDVERGITVSFKINPKESLVRGGKISRSCIVSHWSWSVTWITPMDSREIPSDTLYIANLSSENNGVYTCKAFGPGAPMKLSFKVSV